MHAEMDILEKPAEATLEGNRRAPRLQDAQPDVVEGLPPLVGGKAWTRSVAHLVARMIFRRRVWSRPLENKGAAYPAAASPSCTRRPSSLRPSGAAGDVL
ncbi:hypothetical protein C8Q76DRAFT_792556 [Earliella scabrosa]|nr:hypothetical protein C8Q76DRAFT_792556 [Earliella scabrosa]